MKDQKVFFRSDNMDEITAAMGELNVAHSRGGLFEEDYRRETGLFGELRAQAEEEREKLGRRRDSAETRKKSHVSVARAVETALDSLERDGELLFTLEAFVERVNLKREMPEEECREILEKMVEAGRLYTPTRGRYGIV
jgi:hypothetical protein